MAILSISFFHTLTFAVLVITASLNSDHYVKAFVNERGSLATIHKRKSILNQYSFLPSLHAPKSYLAFQTSPILFVSTQSNNGNNYKNRSKNKQSRKPSKNRNILVSAGEESKTPSNRNKNMNRQNGNYNQQKHYQEKTVVIIYHKPADVVTTHASESGDESRKNVYEDVFSMKGFISSPSDTSTNFDGSDLSNNREGKSFAEVTGIRSKLHAIGRLDAATTGALLLTNDSLLVHYITNPNACIDGMNDNEKNIQRKKIIKTYTALIMGYHEDPATCEKNASSSILSQILEGGIIIPGSSSPTLPVPFIKVLSHPTPKTTLVQLGLMEGKNRHIRKLFHTLKSGVMRLHRDKVGDVDLEEEGLNKEGMWRILSEEEVLGKLGWRTRNLDNHPKEDVTLRRPDRDKRRRRRR